MKIWRGMAAIAASTTSSRMPFSRDARSRHGRGAGDRVAATGRDGAAERLYRHVRAGVGREDLRPAALLALKRVRPGEHVSGEDGIYRLPDVLRSTDEDPQPTLTLADAIRVSSNIAMVEIRERGLTPAEQYRMLRDFGFRACSRGSSFDGGGGGEVCGRPPSGPAPAPRGLAIGYSCR